MTGLARSCLHIASTCSRVLTGSLSASSSSITLPWRTSPIPLKPSAASALPIALPCGSSTSRLSLTCTRTFMFANLGTSTRCSLWRRHDITPGGGVRQPFGKAEYRSAFRLAARRQGDQRTRHGAVAAGTEAHRGGSRLVRRRPGAAEQGLPAKPVIVIWIRRRPRPEGRQRQFETPDGEIVEIACRDHR